jgi:hypothetical protein
MSEMINADDLKGLISKPTFFEIEERIRRDLKYFNGELPARNAIAWGAYIAALLEWGQISVSEHSRLCQLLPQIEDNPVLAILLGRHGSE